jgi:hypothetical protein
MAEMDIDQLVREVLSQLTGRNENSPTSTTAAISDRVISVEILARQPKATDRITIPTGAIVTPAAQDYLTENNIAVATGDGIRTEPSGTKLIFSASETSFDPTTLISNLRRHSIDVEQLPKATIRQTAMQFADRLANEIAVGMLLTDRTSPALCLANRFAHVRAARVDNVADLRDAIDSIGVNLIITNPIGRSQFDLLGITKELHTAGRPQQPASFK